MSVTYLPPTVVAPLISGSGRVRIEGLLSAWAFEVEVEVEGLVNNTSARFPTGLESVTVDLGFGLDPGDLVRARLLLTLGGFANMPFSGFSPQVKVLQFDPGVARPVRVRLPWAFDPRQAAVAIRGIPPGYRVQVEQQIVGPIGVGFGGPAGTAVVDLGGTSSISTRLVTAFVSAGGARSFPVAPEQLLVPQPSIDRSFAGQTVVVVRHLLPGARVELEAPAGGPLGTVQHRLADVDGVAPFAMPAPLSLAMPMRARSIDPVGPWSATVGVAAAFLCGPPPPGMTPLTPIRADEVPFPRIRGPLNSGDSHVWLDRWVPGRPVEIWRLDRAPDDPPSRPQTEDSTLYPVPEHTLLGMRTVGSSGRIALDSALEAPVPATGLATWIVAVQRVDGALQMSSGVRVEPLSYWADTGLSLEPPTILEPVSDCGQAVRVGGVIPGAEVIVYQDEQYAGWARAGLGGTVRVEVLTLQFGARVTAEQVVGPDSSGPSAGVAVTFAADVEPVVLEPSCVGDRRVWASSIAPGSEVAAFDAEGWLGATVTPEPIAKIPLWRPIVGPTVRVETRLCDNTFRSEEVEAAPAVMADQTVDIYESFVDLTGTQWPGRDVDLDGVVEELKGQLYLPDPPPSGPGAPLVLVLHGINNAGSIHSDFVAAESPCVLAPGAPALQFFAKNSYRGYDRLCRNLARHGVVVVSLAVDDSSPVDPDGSTPRADFLQHALETFVGDGRALGLAQDAFVGGPVGLVGHSVGGDAALIVASLAGSAFPSLGGNPVVAVAAVAPSSHGIAMLTPTPIVPVPAMFLFGSADGFISSPAEADLSPWTWLPSMADEWTWGWALGAEHEAWNAIWSGRGGPLNQYSASLAGPEDLEYEEALAAMGSVFLLRHLLPDLETYGRFLSGPVRPEAVEAIPIRFDHQPSPVDGPLQVVIEDFDGGLARFNSLGGRNVFSGPLSALTFGGAASGPTPLGTAVYLDTGASLAISANAGDRCLMRWSPASVPLTRPRWLSIRLAALPWLDGTVPGDPRWFRPAGGDVLVTLSDGVSQATLRAGVGDQELLPTPERLAESRLAVGYTQNAALPLFVPQTAVLDLLAFTAINPALSLTGLSAITLQITGVMQFLDLFVDDVVLSEGA